MEQSIEYKTNMPDDIGIVIPCYNRPALLKRTLEDLNKTLLPDVKRGCIILIDDASQDHETIRIISEYDLPSPFSWDVKKIFHRQNVQMYNSLREGFELLVNDGFTTLCNIDSDVLLKPFWLLAELRLLRKFPDRVISGFNFKPQCFEEKNRFYAKGYVLRIFMGGINFLFSKDTYYKYVKNAFDNKLQWDWKVCDNQFKDGKLLVTTCPSVIQHNIDVSDKNKDVSIVAPDFEDFDEIWERILFI